MEIINKIPEIAKIFNMTPQNLYIFEKREDKQDHLGAYDLYATAKKHNLTLEDAHQALIMFAEVKKHIKEKI